MPDVYRQIRESKSKDWPEATTFAYCWQGVECSILLEMLKYAASAELRSVTLSFDGFRIDRNRLLSMEEARQDMAAARDSFCEDLATTVERGLGYKVEVVEKLVPSLTIERSMIGE